MRLTACFTHTAHAIQSDVALHDDQIASVAPSIFSEVKHAGRSDRYWHIPTITVLNALRAEGFQPFMVCQTAVRRADRRAYTKHMVRLRHASHIAGAEAEEVILVNSHDGNSCYQMLAGMFRFVCKNGLVCGTVESDVRLPHRKGVVDDVVARAYETVGRFGRLRDMKEQMTAMRLDDAGQRAFAKSAIALHYGDLPTKRDAAHLTPDDMLQVRRSVDASNDLWTIFNRIQENMLRGGLHACTTNGRRITTRAVFSIDASIRLNRELWRLAEATLHRCR